VVYYRDSTGKFPEYPEEDEGGSAAIFTPKDPAEVYDNFLLSFMLCFI